MENGLIAETNKLSWQDKLFCVFVFAILFVSLSYAVFTRASRDYETIDYSEELHLRLSVRSSYLPDVPFVFIAWNTSDSNATDIFNQYNTIPNEIGIMSSFENSNGTVLRVEYITNLTLTVFEWMDMCTWHGTESGWSWFYSIDEMSFDYVNYSYLPDVPLGIVWSFHINLCDNDLTFELIRGE